MALPKMKTMRGARNWTQDYLAERAGVSPATVFRAESGSRLPSSVSLIAIADAFGTTLDDLLGRSVPANDKAPTDAERRNPVGA